MCNIRVCVLATDKLLFQWMGNIGTSSPNHYQIDYIYIWFEILCKYRLLNLSRVVTGPPVSISVDIKYQYKIYNFDCYTFSYYAHSFIVFCMFQHIEAETERLIFSRRHFQIYFLNDNVWIYINISLKSIPNGPINNIPSLVQIMAWSRSDGWPLFEPLMVWLSMHIYVTRPQWIKL